ncbi:MAG TPA: septum formation initiator family protein [Syntrophorhabdaceae bacterium]|nr:septum formation initiator family protein [Syntrophorhabdaceae bacterium]
MTENPVKRYGFIILISMLFFQIAFSDGGVYDCIKTKRKIGAIDQAIRKTEKENAMLAQELEKLQKDDQYLEDVVRIKYGFVRDGEKVYRVEK